MSTTPFFEILIIIKVNNDALKIKVIIANVTFKVFILFVFKLYSKYNQSLLSSNAFFKLFLIKNRETQIQRT